MEKNELKKLLLEGTEKLIAQLSEILDKNSGLYNEMIILSKKYYEGKMEINLGTIKFEDWNILKTQVDVGLLDLIDRIQKPEVHEKKQTIKQKNRIVEDTIKWLINVLTGQRISSEEVEHIDMEDWKEKHIKRSSWEVGQINIDDEGNFNIINIRKFEIESSHLSEYDEEYNESDEYELFSLYTVYEQHSIYGKVSDIDMVEIRENKTDKCYHVILKSINKKDSFYIKKEGKKEHIFFRNGTEKSNPTIEIENNSHFDIGVKDSNTAKSIKNAIDYLAIHFGRKEDAF